MTLIRPRVGAMWWTSAVCVALSCVRYVAHVYMHLWHCRAVCTHKQQHLQAVLLLAALKNGYVCTGSRNKREFFVAVVLSIRLKQLCWRYGRVFLV
jgi:hypothetical protein